MSNVCTQNRNANVTYLTHENEPKPWIVFVIAVVESGVAEQHAVLSRVVLPLEAGRNQHVLLHRFQYFVPLDVCH